MFQGHLEFTWQEGAARARTIDYVGVPVHMRTEQLGYAQHLVGCLKTDHYPIGECVYLSETVDVNMQNPNQFVGYNFPWRLPIGWGLDEAELEDYKASTDQMVGTIRTDWAEGTVGKEEILGKLEHDLMEVAPRSAIRADSVVDPIKVEVPVYIMMRRNLEDVRVGKKSLKEWQDVQREICALAKTRSRANRKERLDRHIAEGTAGLGKRARNVVLNIAASVDDVNVSALIDGCENLNKVSSIDNTNDWNEEGGTFYQNLYGLTEEERDVEVAMVHTVNAKADEEREAGKGRRVRRRAAKRKLKIKYGNEECESDKGEILTEDDEGHRQLRPTRGPISTEILENTLETMSLRKAAGSDGLTFETVRHASSAVHVLLLEVLNLRALGKVSAPDSWHNILAVLIAKAKKGKAVCWDSLRTISLSATLQKVYLTCLLSVTKAVIPKLEWWILGGMPGRQAADVLLYCRVVARNCTEWNTPCAIGRCDIFKCFDRVHRSALYRELAESGLPWWLVQAWMRELEGARLFSSI